MIQEKLALEFRAVPAYRQELARSYNGLGALFSAMDRRADAESAFRSALTIQEKLTTEFGTVPAYRQELATSQSNLGAMLAGQRRCSEAEAADREALTIQEKLAAEFPDEPAYRQEQARTYNNIALSLAGQNKRFEAEAAYRQALAILEQLAPSFPNVPRYRIDLGNSQVNFGDLQRANQQPEQALQWYAKGIEAPEAALRQVKVDAMAKRALLFAHAGRAQAMDDLKRYSEAVRDWDRAQEFASERDLVWLRTGRALSRVRAGDVDEALKEADDLSQNASAETLYNTACVVALAAGRQGAISGARSKDECAKRAVELLRMSVAKGWTNAELIHDDEDLKALREREVFKKLLAELASRKKK
jgi:tetratricopeptide (TPR) repeat protein